MGPESMRAEGRAASGPGAAVAGATGAGEGAPSCRAWEDPPLLLQAQGRVVLRTAESMALGEAEAAGEIRVGEGALQQEHLHISRHST